MPRYGAWGAPLCRRAPPGPSSRPPLKLAMLGCAKLQRLLARLAGPMPPWLKGRCERGQFKIEWAPGPTNRADYTTKNHPGPHHQLVRPIQLYIKGKSPTTLQGCDRITGASSRPTKGTKIGLLDKLKSSLPNIGINRLYKLTF